MTQISSLCVYCGSRIPRDPAHIDAAKSLGKALAENGIRLVYGGGHVGLMGVIADATLNSGGQVTGIIPGHLHDIEVSHEKLTELHIVDSMHARKEKMFQTSDAFAVLPGGLGTLDETFEMVTWRQLRLHDKPIILVNYKNYWRPLLDLMAHMIEAGFVEEQARGYFTVVEELKDIIPALAKAPDAEVKPDISKF
ncbi:TIGR00730 family Rossman fold protein [Sneathiella sp.]|uniref:LOG family protein n=1 Tax=Sneathiella sp. TaxID=1964365 RepID=UPI0026192D81|nr:TIGR00730 family Rossman fold protein [Sneathiella sp.]MDF2368905.1 TIGR00730 family Rossman fold protein [Sneathiella sp.]